MPLTTSSATAAAPMPFGIKSEQPSTVLQPGQAIAIDGALKVRPTAEQVKAGAAGFFALLRKVYPDYIMLNDGDLKAIIASDMILSSDLKLWLEHPKTALTNGVVFPAYAPDLFFDRSGKRGPVVAKALHYAPVMKLKPGVDNDYTLQGGSFTVTNDNDTSKYFSAMGKDGQLVVKSVRVYRQDEVDNVAVAQLHAFESVACKLYGFTLAQLRSTLLMNDTLVAARDKFLKGGDVVFPSKLLQPTAAQVELDQHADEMAHYDKLLEAKPKDHELHVEYADYLQDEIIRLEHLRVQAETADADKVTLKAKIDADRKRLKAFYAKHPELTRN